MAKKRALLVAINDYPGDRNDLQSCLNDLTAMEQTIADDFGFTDIAKLKDGDATTAKVEAGLKELFKDASLGDQLLFYYSGHGTQIPNGTIIEEALYLFDGTLIDNKLVELAKGLPPGVLTVFLDSCFSGGMEKKLLVADNLGDVARAKWAVPETTEKLVEQVKAETQVTGYRPFGCYPIKSKFTPKALNRAFGAAKVLKASVNDSDEAGQLQLNGLLIAASQELETASASTFATMGLSAFTFCFRNALTAAKTASVNYLVSESDRVLKSVGFRQTPMVKSNPISVAGLAFLSGTTGTKGGGKGFYPPPPCFPGVWAGFNPELNRTKGEQKVFGIDDAILIPALAGVLTAAINANKKSVDEKIFGIDDAILIPIVASVITTAINAANKSLDISVGVGISIKAIEIAQAVAQTMKSTAGNEKIIGIDDAILIPAIASILTAAITSANKGFSISVSGGVVTPIGGGNFGVGVGVKGAPDKVFGIDDAILIPALVSVITAAINANQKSAASQKVFGIDDAILIPALVTVVTAAINARK